MVVRNEVDVLAVNLAYHRALGIGECWVVDNGSSDGTVEVLRRVEQQMPGLHWSRDLGPFRPGDMQTALARDAMRAGAEWVIPIDADEFWTTASGSLADVLDDTSAGALEAQVLNFVQDRRVRTARPRSLLTMTHRVAEPVGESVAVPQIYAKTLAFIEMRYPSKWVARTSAELTIEHGNHAVHGVAGPLTASSRITCLHAPLRSRAALDAKVEHGRRVIEAGFPEGQGWHVKRWQEIADGEGRPGLDAEWRANSQRGGGLDVYGTRHGLVEDLRLRAAVAPHIRRFPRRLGFR
jgi:hypothetical protein